MNKLSIGEFLLEVDQDGLFQRGQIIDEDISLLNKENRVGLWMDRFQRHTSDRIGQENLYIRFQCSAHPHPECRFNWVRVLIDFLDPNVYSINDMSPREVKGETPIKIVTSYTGGTSLNTEFLGVKISPNISAENKTEREVYFPEITSSGIGSSKAIWTFQALLNDSVYINRDLSLLVGIPVSVGEIEANVSVRARVFHSKWQKVIPLVGKKTAKFDSNLKF